jgi:hypothetical protein
VIFRTAGPFGEAPFLQTIKQLHGAVMLDLEALRDMADGRNASLRKTLQSQKQLVVLRLEASRPRRLFAEMEKAPDLMAELRQSSILGIRYINPCCIHVQNYIVLRYEKFRSVSEPLTEAVWHGATPSWTSVAAEGMFAPQLGGRGRRPI